MAKAELVLIGTDDGVILLSNPGGIGRWLKSAHMLRGHGITATWAHPNDPTRMLCCDDTHLWQSLDGGQTWNSSAGPACRQMIASRSTPDRIWAHDGQSAYMSRDAGSTWQVVAPSAQIAGGGELLWYHHAAQGHLSRDGGETWHTTPAWPSVAMSYDGQHLWHGDQQTLYYHDSTIDGSPAGFVPLLAGVGAPYVVGTSPTALWRYADAWHMVDTVGTSHISALTTTIYHPDRAWAGDIAGNLWYSGDRCMTWELVRGGFAPIRAIASARLL